MVTVPERGWTSLFAGLDERQFRKLVGVVRVMAMVRRPLSGRGSCRRRAGTADGRILTHELDIRQLGSAVQGVEVGRGLLRSTASPRFSHWRRYCADILRRMVLIVGGTLTPTHDRNMVASSKSHRYYTNHQAAIDTNIRRVVVA
ncbi:hypothetical protein ACPCTO_37505 [Streptomyces olivoreticuli]